VTTESRRGAAECRAQISIGPAVPQTVVFRVINVRGPHRQASGFACRNAERGLRIVLCQRHGKTRKEEETPAPPRARAPLHHTGGRQGNTDIGGDLLSRGPTRYLVLCAFPSWEERSR